MSTQDILEGFCALGLLAIILELWFAIGMLLEIQGDMKKRRTMELYGPSAIKHIEPVQEL